MAAQPFEQNVIALIWDFDKTLINGYMQAPIFRKYGVDGARFWSEVNALAEKYRKLNPDMRVNSDTIYLNHFLTCVKQGIFKGLNNRMLRELGRELTFFDGLPEFFTKLKTAIERDERYRKYNITVEHYIVSTGLAEMIRGSAIAQYADGIWGCEFIERPIASELAGPAPAEEEDGGREAEIDQIAYAIDNTSKTRAIFEINKGSNKNANIDVNSSMDRSLRRVPFEHMIYIADGPSDVPAFSILKQNGGKTFAVYPAGSPREFEQVDRLRRDQRIDMYGEADYREDTLTHMWLTEHARQIAEKIYNAKEQAIINSVSRPPGHINESTGGARG